MTESRGAVQTIEIYDGDRLLGSAASDDGHWTFEATGLSTGAHQFVAVKDGLRSNVWNITVEPLSVDQSPMILDGYSVLVAWPLTGADAPRNTEIRLPTGGVPPYSYTSDQAEVATVTSAGKVKGVANGSATITVRDTGTASVSYRVEVSNIWKLTMSQGPFNAHQAMDWIENSGGVPSMAVVSRAVTSMYVAYSKPFPIGTTHYWLCPEGEILFWFYNYRGQTISAAASDFGPTTGAWCFTYT